MKIPITGCDGMPQTGQTWVRNGTLAATVFIRPNTDLAIEMLVENIKSGAPLPERKVTDPVSIPTLEELAATAKKLARTAKV
jgi:hypothetical protein